MKIIATLLTLFITAPIWFYLLYKILIAVDANETMFFLYWIYLPAHIFASVINRIAESEINKGN